MTRDFNNNQRENTRSFPRNNSSFNNRNSGEGQGQNARTGRPRLNREIVDRAWESGARQQHADYRPRTSPSHNGQAIRGNGNPNFQNRPYGNRDQNGYSDNRRTYGGDRPNFNRDRDQQGGPGYNPNRRDSRPPFTRENNHQENRPGFNRDNDQRGPGNFQRDNRPGFNRDNRPPYNRDNDQRGGASFQRGPGGYQENRPGFNRDSRPAFNRNNDQRGPGNFQESRPGYNRPNNHDERPDSNREGGRPGFNRDSRPPFNRDNDQRGPRPAQRDSRPGFNRNQRGPGGFDRPNNAGNPGGPRQFNRDGGQQFEGDYEHFNSHDERGRSTGRPFQGRTSPAHSQKPERHVTRMDDGRVIKGPRPVQRKAAQFWEEIGKDTQNLVAPIQATPEVVTPEQAIILPTEGEEVQAGEATEVKKKPVARRPRTTAAAARSKRTEAKKRSTGPKPSQKGFKWPTTEAPAD